LPVWRPVTIGRRFDEGLGKPTAEPSSRSQRLATKSFWQIRRQLARVPPSGVWLLLNSLRVNLGRIESSKALDTVNASANQLALAAMLHGRVVLAKTIGARLSLLMD
jgi:hypothetical protein